MNKSGQTDFTNNKRHVSPFSKDTIYISEQNYKMKNKKKRDRSDIGGRIGGDIAWIC
jgi:hypothetical protein